jgi:hypothetical protein
VLVAVLLAAATSVPIAQLRYSTGQSVAPVFEGWRRNADGSYRFYFGYMNRNYDQALDLPVGPSNQFEPGPADRGQPTHFLQRRQRFVFTVTVPKEWDLKQRLTWTVVANGQTEKAQGWLQPEWEIDDGVIAMNIGGGSSPPTPNAAPTIQGTPAPVTASANTAITLMVTATDDGIPKPRGAAASAPSPRGVTVRWQKYRGPGDVTFSSATTEGVHGKPVESSTQVRFSRPGDYVVRAIASDGYLESIHTINISVK